MQESVLRERLAKQLAERVVKDVRAIGKRARDYARAKASVAFNVESAAQGSSLVAWLAQRSCKHEGERDDYTVLVKCTSERLVPHLDRLIECMVLEIAAAYRVGLNYYAKRDCALYNDSVLISDSLLLAKSTVYERLAKSTVYERSAKRKATMLDALLRALRFVADMYQLKAGSCDVEAATMLGYDVGELVKLDRAYYCVFNCSASVGMLTSYLANSD